jgi:hypothetical protein
MKKWYNFETSFVTLANDLSAFLKRSGIYYERSGAFGNYHFEVLADMDDVVTVNAFLDVHTIKEVRA